MTVNHKYPWQEDGERWYTFSSFCRHTFGKKLFRVPLDIGCTCPNRDGSLGKNGCIFCDEGGSGDFAIKYEGQSLTEDDLIWNHQKSGDSDPSGKYIAYFQSYTNTYASLERLEKIFGAALDDPLFAGISIGTRPDCLGIEGIASNVLSMPNGPVIPMLRRLKMSHPDKFIWVELGLQTIHDKTAGFIRRGYPLEVFDRAVEELRKADISVICHVILGLPGETEEMNLKTIEYLNKAGISGIKLQLLHYLKGTDLGRMWQAQHPDGEFGSMLSVGTDTALEVLSETDYVNIITDCLAHLSPETVVHRLTGDGAPELLLSPTWSRAKNRVINNIRHTMKERDLVQGSAL